jgi:hypothetical protein
MAWNVSSRERRIEPFVDIPYLVTDNVVVVAPRRARVLGDVQAISGHLGERAVTPVIPRMAISG